uniref:Uncharacterized protein n=1 Tax=Pipistrellus kuhlii TaxID=59472 RepID=A0A7J8B1H6_PIPKU|nr:hypothetical protein mPipKuh1_007848 [Pipistrellus kuhlii]
MVLLPVTQSRGWICSRSYSHQGPRRESNLLLPAPDTGATDRGHGSLQTLSLPGLECNLFFFFFLMYFIVFFFTERIELETSMRESSISCLLPPTTGNVPITKVHALDQNRTWDLSVNRPMLYPLSQTGFGKNAVLIHLHPRAWHLPPQTRWGVPY